MKTLPPADGHPDGNGRRRGGAFRRIPRLAVAAAFLAATVAGCVSVPQGGEGRRAPGATARADEVAADEVVVTGSLLPRQISDDGDLPLSSSPLGVLTAEQIQRLGAANLSQALSRGIPTPR